MAARGGEKHVLGTSSPDSLPPDRFSLHCSQARCRRRSWHKTKRTKRRKNEENSKNNKFVRQRSIVTCPASSTPRRSLKLSMFFRSSYFFIIIDKMTVRLPSHSPTLIIVKEACPTAELYCGIACLWIFDSRPLLMNLNLSWRITILIIVLCKFSFAFLHGFLVKQGFFFIISFIISSYLQSKLDR